VQKSLCTNVLSPLISRSLIYDNGASMKGKGIHFALNRAKVHLRRHYKDHGIDGYVLLVDFKGYFENILHAPIREIYTRLFGEDENLLNLAMSFVDAFGEKGLGLGSETSQINAIAYASKIDHFVKEVLLCKYYGRYMDDSYFICESKERAQYILSVLFDKYAALGITVNPKKTVITKLSRGFTFLKTRFTMSDTGRIIARPCRENITRQRRKLKKFKKFLDKGEMTISDIQKSYASWRGYIVYKNAHRTVQSMDRLYTRLFGTPPSKTLT